MPPSPSFVSRERWQPGISALGVEISDLRLTVQYLPFTMYGLDSAAVSLKLQCCSDHILALPARWVAEGFIHKEHRYASL